MPDDSDTETYAALRLEVHNWRWAGVPIFLRTGKRLARKVTEIAVQLKPVPHMAFQSQGLGRRAAQPADPHGAAQRGRLALAGREDPGREHADPAGEHGVPLRHVVHVAVAGGLRAADPRRDARRRDALHPQRRGRRAVVDHRPDPAGVGRGPPAAGEYEAGSPGRPRPTTLLGEGRHWRPLCSGRGLVRARHDAGADRGGAARSSSPSATTRTTVRARARAQPRRRRRPRVPRRDREPPRARRPLPPVAARAVRGRARAARRSTRGPASAPTTPSRCPATRGRARAGGDRDRPAAPPKLDTIVDPLLVTDLATMVWAPHGHAEAVDALRRLAQIVLVDTQDEPDVAARWRACSRPRPSTPTSSTSRGCARRRGASAWRPPSTRRRCARRSAASRAVTVRHREDSVAAALLFCGWLASRLGWKPGAAVARRPATDRPRAGAPAGGADHARAGRIRTRRGSPA